MASGPNSDVSAPKPSSVLPAPCLNEEPQQPVIATDKAHSGDRALSGMLGGTITDQHLTEMDKLISGTDQTWTNLLGNSKDVDELFKGFLSEHSEPSVSSGTNLIILFIFI